MFTNVKNLICAKNFSRPNNFILKHQNQVLSPVDQFYTPNIQPNNTQTPFELSMISLALTKQQDKFQNLLKLEENQASFKQFNEQIQQKAQISQQLAQSYLKECQLVFQMEGFDIPVKAYTSFTLASVMQNQINIQYFEKYIFNNILKKMQYLDKQGLEDLLIALNQMNYSNKKFIEQVLNAYEAKNIEYQECVLYAWTMDQYDRTEKKENLDIYDRYYNDLKNNAIMANQRHEIRQFLQEIQNRFLNRMMFREHRVKYNFSENKIVQIQPILDSLKAKLIS